MSDLLFSEKSNNLSNGGKTGKNSAKPSDVRFTISLSYYFKRDVFTTSKTGLESKKKEKVSFSFSLQLASCSREEEGF